MLTAVFEFHPDLNLFLSPQRREGVFSVSFEAGQTVKHLIESVGLPHTETGVILANQAPAGFDYRVRDGDRIDVFAPVAGQGVPEGGPCFVLDNHLGRLAVYLRMFGLDVIYRNDLQDEELAQIASQEKRILLSRDRRLLMRKAIQYGYCLRSLDSRQQLREVLQRYQLPGHIAPFQRCLRCNTPLHPVEKESILEFLRPLTRMYYDEFQRCPACGNIYWKGSHYEHMLTMVEQFNPAGFFPNGEVHPPDILPKT